MRSRTDSLTRKIESSLCSIKTWPKHGIRGTAGAVLCTPISNLVREKIIQAVVDKGRHAAAFSAFEALDPRGHLLVDVLREQRIDHIDICGFITEYGILASALDARKHEFQVRVLVNLCGAANPEAGQRAFERIFPGHVQHCKQPFLDYTEEDFVALERELNQLKRNLDAVVARLKA